MVRPRCLKAGVAAATGCLALLAGQPVAAADPAAAPTIVIPAKGTTEKRLITIDDIARIRDIDSLSVSPDGRRFAILVRQAVPEANSYRNAWFAGALEGGEPLRYLGDAGEMRLLTRPHGGQTGDIGGSVSRWSPDGKFILYSVKKDGAVQLWTSDIASGAQRQITRGTSDVRDFVWDADGKRLLFSRGSTRTELEERAEAAHRSGYLFQDYHYFFGAANPGVPTVPLETKLDTWSVAADGSDERPASAEEAERFAALRGPSGMRGSGAELHANRTAALRPPIVAESGAAAWLERDPGDTGNLPFARLWAATEAGGTAIRCDDPRCAGQLISNIWWRPGQDEIIIWKRDGETDMRPSIYGWTPRSGQVRTILSSDDHRLTDCVIAPAALVCLREMPLEPRHVATIGLARSEVAKVGNVNPEFSAFRLGSVKRLEWDNPPDEAELGYSRRTAGILLYPPGYDPKRTYPLFVAPYRGGGFLRGDVGDEHPLLAYAAKGIIVLHSFFPLSVRAQADGDAVRVNRRHYDPDKGYPHLIQLADTTFRGIDLAMKHANIDAARIGIGGVSHGAFIPLFMLQKQDRLAALSVASGSFNSTEYDFSPMPFPYADNVDATFPDDPDFWKGMDLSQHLDTIEAPILFNVATSEIINVARLTRRMSSARLPYEAVAYHGEAHLKWQSAHRLTIYRRNLDWFRFWLQDIEDPSPAKADQYERWRKLRDLQCRNPRSLPDYCSVISRQDSP